MSEKLERCPVCGKPQTMSETTNTLPYDGGWRNCDYCGAEAKNWQSRPIEDELRAEIELLREIAKASNMLIQFGIRHSAECSIYDGNDICDCGRDEYVSNHAKAWDRWQRNALKAGRDE